MEKQHLGHLTQSMQPLPRARLATGPREGDPGADHW